MYFVKNLIHKFLNRQISIIYNKRFQKYLNTSKGVFWNSKLSQDLRLNIILDIVIKESKSNTVSLADVGCGYGRLLGLIKERDLIDKIEYYGFDINNKFISFCSKNNIFEKVSFEVGTCPSENVDFVVMSGTYNLTPINNKSFWEDYIIKNLTNNWKFVRKAMIFNCLVKDKREIDRTLYYTELSWIKKMCEENFCNPEVIRHNLLKEDITIILKK